MSESWFSPQVVMQFKELIALVTLVWLLIHTYTRTIPRIQSDFMLELKAVLGKLDDTLDKLTLEIRNRK
ncbi:MAG: hypothetical protein E6Q97_10840 [Desulfurellales bacterium]|nr:MAG: hypothetical protein E6Q97_10840 [Desulfurellales bacterium]